MRISKITTNVDQHVAYFEYTRLNGKSKRRIAIGFGTVDEAQKFLRERDMLWMEFFRRKEYFQKFVLGVYNDYYFEKISKGGLFVSGEIVIDGFGHGSNPDQIYSMKRIELIRENYSKVAKEDPEEKKIIEDKHPKCILIKAVYEDDLKI